jgi:hypothetical protein
MKKRKSIYSDSTRVDDNPIEIEQLNGGDAVSHEHITEIFVSVLGDLITHRLNGIIVGCT